MSGLGWGVRFKVLSPKPYTLKVKGFSRLPSGLQSTRRSSAGQRQVHTSEHASDGSVLGCRVLGFRAGSPPNLTCADCHIIKGLHDDSRVESPTSRPHIPRP